MGKTSRTVALKFGFAKLDTTVELAKKFIKNFYAVTIII